MKQFFKFFFASLLALVVGGVLFFAVFFAIIGSISKSITSSVTSKSESSGSVKDNAILHIDLTNAFHELGETNSLAFFTGGKSSSAGLYDLIRALKNAKNDNKIIGVYLNAGGTPNGIGTLQQIREALVDFKSSGKFIYAYGDYFPQGDYYVASVADSIFVNPLGSVEVKGLSSQIMFFKGALDKLDVKPEIFYCGQFKSATEPFRLDKMSEPNRHQIASIQKGMWHQMLAAIAEHTQTDTATINNWASNYTIRNAQDAVAYKLIEGVRYKDEIEELLRKKTGQSEKEKINFVSLKDYTGSIPVNLSQDRIAILVGEGQIVEGTSNSSSYQIAAEDFVKEIRKVRDDEKIKAVVLRVNSPGGSALASEIILRELQILQRKKPLVVSMGDLAASGGYYISCAADSIFALDNTITGSIGVFGMMFNTQGFFNKKLGVTFDEEKNAPMADFPNLNRPMTEKEKTVMQKGVDDIYTTFTQHVSKGRKMDINYVDSIGQGRIWTGSIALENGLVDAIGGLDRAVLSAASLAKLNDYRVVTYPKSEDKLERILRMMGSAEVSKESLMTEHILENELGIDYRWFSLLRSIKEQKSRVWMMLPFHIEVK